MTHQAKKSTHYSPQSLQHRIDTIEPYRRRIARRTEWKNPAAKGPIHENLSKHITEWTELTSIRGIPLPRPHMWCSSLQICDLGKILQMLIRIEKIKQIDLRTMPTRFARTRRTPRLDEIRPSSPRPTDVVDPRDYECQSASNK